MLSHGFILLRLQFSNRLIRSNGQFGLSAAILGRRFARYGVLDKKV
jgi:hypothetical protein